MQVQRGSEEGGERGEGETTEGETAEESDENSSCLLWGSQTVNWREGGETGGREEGGIM